MTVLLLTSLIFSFVRFSSGANILACLPTPSFSHQIAYREIWKELSLRGHKVTLITTDPMNDATLTNLTEIDMKFSYAVFKNISNMAENDVDMWNFQKTIRPMFKGIADAQLAHGLLQDLIHNRNHKFDLVLVEFLFPEFLAFAEIYGCPKIIFSSLDASVIFHNAIGNTIHPALYTDIIAPFYPPLSFWERVKNTLYTYHVLNYIHRYTYSDKDETIRNFFNISTTTSELISDIDILLLNIHPVINYIRAVGPTTVTIGDIRRVRPTKSLKKDLQEYLDSAKDGFIYFSLGSNVKSKELKKDSLNSIMQALAHPNIKVFVTQGGLQSMEEGVYNGVPFVVIPFYADQDQNALLMKGKGIAVIVDRQPFVGKHNLKEAMLEVINNPRYKNAAVRLKQLAIDMPMTGLEKAIWWIEYVIRNKGAKHLKNPTADLPFYQYYLVDVIGFLIAVAVITLSTLFILLRKFVRLLKSIVVKPLAKNKKIQ